MRKGKRRKQNEESTSVSEMLVTSTGELSAIIDGGNFCNADQCGIRPSASRTVIQPIEAAPASLLSGQELSALFSDNLYQMLKEAAQQGFLVSFLLTLADEGASKILKAKNYNSEQIHYANQAIRAMALLAIGTSPEIVLATPVANYLLTHYFGMKNSRANYITTGVTLAYEVLHCPLSAAETSLTIATSIAATVVGSKAASYGFNALHGFFRPQKEHAVVDAPFKSRILDNLV